MRPLPLDMRLRTEIDNTIRSALGLHSFDDISCANAGSARRCLHPLVHTPELLVYPAASVLQRSPNETRPWTEAVGGCTGTPLGKPRQEAIFYRCCSVRRGSIVVSCHRDVGGLFVLIVTLKQDMREALRQ